tara:strand:+ start:413 stop:814 length:402 start_codon:yes stop_codon:yes gene_type:complete
MKKQQLKKLIRELIEEQTSKEVTLTDPAKGGAGVARKTRADRRSNTVSNLSRVAKRAKGNDPVLKKKAIEQFEGQTYEELYSMVPRPAKSMFPSKGPTPQPNDDPREPRFLQWLALAIFIYVVLFEEDGEINI